MKYPVISIVIPTYNSEATISKTLDFVKKQTYPKNKIEVLIVDGGSTDRTVEIVEKYKYKVIPNPKIDQVFAKHIGFLRSSGRYLVNLDSDEVLENPESLQTRLKVFQENSRVRGLMASGLKTPKGYSSINYYINDLGEPFSFFVYSLSQDYRFYISQLSKIGSKASETQDYVIFDFSRTRSLPIIELTGAGGMIDLEYARKEFPQLKKDPALGTFIFYLFNSRNCFLAVTKNDNIVHYSSASPVKYFKKIRSRIKNNVYQTTMGRSGFLGREQFHSEWLNFKKYLFLPYSLSIVFPFFDTVRFIFTRRNLIYLLHPFLCLYISALVLYYSLLKSLGIKPEVRGYGY